MIKRKNCVILVVHFLLYGDFAKSTYKVTINFANLQVNSVKNTELFTSFVELVCFYRIYRLLFVQKMYIAVAAKVLEGLSAVRRQVGRIDIIVVAEAEEGVA